ncbi:MAG: hypothetical protein MUE60_11460 [Candidatus Eisenbacteria bacterium]|jgi:type II secretory pathway pseudopilin PulG|nr:hypothetical protein [Candidatus Eisenbacteria bacterium]
MRFSTGRHRGYSITEMTIALALILILAKTAVPVFGHAFFQANSRAGTDQVAVCFRFARQAAITGRIYSRVTVGPDTALVVVNAATGAPLRRFGLPRSVTVRGPLPAFTPGGVCTTSGQVSVSDGSSSGVVTYNIVGLVEVIYR